MPKINVRNLQSPILLQGDRDTAYRDPTAIYQDGLFRLYCTLVESDGQGGVNMFVTMSASHNLIDWSAPKKLTPQDKRLNFSSPGNIIRFHDTWLMCVQTYPRPNGEKSGNQNSRIWVMESHDLETWNEPRLLKVKGPHIPWEKMGRMIDPYLIEDKDEPGKWWCFYKQNGASMSYSHDLSDWVYAGSVNAGENVCVLVKEQEYHLFHSPKNGIGLMTSRNLQSWMPVGDLLTFGQQNWKWAKGRLTAGFVLDCRNETAINVQYLMFFHGTGPEDEQTIFDTHACIGLAWSDDLIHWDWSGKED